MTIRERRRRRRRRRLIKRLSAAGLILFAVGVATLAILAATNRQEAAEPPFSLSVGEMPTISPEAATEPPEAPQRGARFRMERKRRIYSGTDGNGGGGG